VTDVSMKTAAPEAPPDLFAVRKALQAALPEPWSLHDEHADDRDVEFLQALYISTRADEMAAVPWSEADKLRFLAEQFRLQRAHYREHYAEAGFWLLHHQQRPAGRIYVFSSPSEYRLMDIALLPEWRGQGIGHCLIEAIQTQAHEFGKGVSLHVEPNNPANRLYERLGFDFVENRGAYRFLRWSPASFD